MPNEYIVRPRQRLTAARSTYPHAAGRSPSICLNQPSSWFQLAKFRLPVLNPSIQTAARSSSPAATVWRDARGRRRPRGGPFSGSLPRLWSRGDLAHDFVDESPQGGKTAGGASRCSSGVSARARSAGRIDARWPGRATRFWLAGRIDSTFTVAIRPHPDPCRFPLPFLQRRAELASHG
jgi:hypothetical protein